MENPKRFGRGPTAITLTGLAAGLFWYLTPTDAYACGCFAPPDPSVPIIQAGERIVFAHENGTITAHIQVQYSGEANEFGWLLPLPSEPEMRLGIEELFTNIVNTTQPKYRLTRVVGDSCEWGRAQNAFPTAGGDASEGNPPPARDDDVIAIRGSVGPFDYAKLQANSKDAMFNWLTDNGFFVPAGTESVVDPYINDGSWFLALKLRKGEETGDLQPVVVEYRSDLPMIPIILTSVAAQEDMGIQVWVLGDSRAIPRNYRHTLLNEEHIDWFNAGINYNDVVIAAIDEADGHHSFITEYAGTTDVMKDLLDFEGRFGSRARFEGLTEAGQYTSELRRNGFVWSSPLINTLREYFPFPERLSDEGVTEADYYQQIDYYLTFDRERRPFIYEGVDFTFDAAAITAKLWERIVTPTLEAGRMFRDHPKMTRMYTTLSPHEMTKDPVFSFNRDLPDVSNVHEATLTYVCSFFQDGPSNTPAVLRLPDTREFYVKTQEEWLARDLNNIPFSTQIQLLREEGPPEIEVDNRDRISGGDQENGCACSTAEVVAPARAERSPLALTLIGLVVFGLLFAIPRRRP